VAAAQQKPDLNSRHRIEFFVERFYERLLADEELAPIFLEVARIDIDVHLPHIVDYWCKLLLGEKGYQRHTMDIHRRLHELRPLREDDFERWLGHFRHTVDTHFTGENAERAKRLATTIAANMLENLPDRDGRAADQKL